MSSTPLSTYTYRECAEAIQLYMEKDTHKKVLDYVKDHPTFDQADWNAVKATIPAIEQEEAETRVHQELKA